MTRKKGSANTDFGAKKGKLLKALREHLIGGTPPSSYRGMALAAGVTIPTLRHYFGDREDVLAAVFADCHSGARGELEIGAAPTGDFGTSIRDLVRHIAGGFRYGGLVELHSVGLTEGLSHARVASAYLSEVLEPTIVAAQTRLRIHMARGEMRPGDARHAAIGLIAPILVLYLHQTALGGSDSYPLDVDAFLAEHATAFLAAHGI